MSIIIVLVIGGAVWWMVYRNLPDKLIRPRRSTREYWEAKGGYLTPLDMQMLYEEMDVRTNDGLKLVGWFIPGTGANATKTIVLLHGIGGSRINMIPTAKIFYDAGFNVFLYDSRAAGESEGEFCTHGYYEKHDLQSVINALCERKEVDPAHIGLLGISMGGSIALQTAAIEPRIKCIIAESVYTNLNEVTGDYLKHFIGFNAKFVHDAAIHVAEKEANFHIGEIAPIEALQHINIPVLFVHGSEDELVKARYSELLWGAYKGTGELYMVRGAGHNDLRKVGGDEYNRRRLDFFERYL